MTRNGAVSHWFAHLPDPDRHYPATGIPTYASSAPATPGCGPPTISGNSTRACESCCWRSVSPVSGPPVVTAAGCPGSRPAQGLLARKHGRDSVIEWQQTLDRCVDEVITVATREGIDADIVKGGNLEVARNAAQADRLRAAVEEDRRWGVEGIEILSASEAAERVRVDSVLSGAFNPQCARVQPAKLVRGLADVVERLGVTIYEQTPVAAITAGGPRRRTERCGHR